MGSIPPHSSPFEPPPTGYSNHGSRPPPSFRRFVDSAMDDGEHTRQGLSLHDGNFDILEWHPAYLSCQKYFLDHAQYEPGSLAVCALINIRLPHQWIDNPVASSSPPQSSHSPRAGTNPFDFNAYARSANSSYNGGAPGGGSNTGRPPQFVSPVPYIRRLVVTGFDKPAILHGLFGDDYTRGIMPHVECERRNYLFAAKHGGWRSCKKQYDTGSGGGGDETVPFMKPLDEASAEELTAAEKAWSSWLAMEDWMVGPRAPTDQEDNAPSARAVTREDDGGTRDGVAPDGT